MDYDLLFQAFLNIQSITSTYLQETFQANKETDFLIMNLLSEIQIHLFGHVVDIVSLNQKANMLDILPCFIRTLNLPLQQDFQDHLWASSDLKGSYTDADLSYYKFSDIDYY